jgi:hypothetical protein
VPQIRCGLTGDARPLYSAGFATLGLRPGVVTSPCGGIGRRARLKIEFRKECWFDSGQGHQKRSRMARGEVDDLFVRIAATIPAFAIAGFID